MEDNPNDRYKSLSQFEPPRSLEQHHSEIVDLAAIAECLDEISLPPEAGGAHQEEDLSINPNISADLRLQVYIDKLWLLYCQQKEAFEAFEEMDVNLTEGPFKYVALFLKNEAEKLDGVYQIILDDIQSTDPTDVVSLNQSIFSIQSEIKTLKKNFEEGCKKIAKSENPDSPHYKKTQEMHSKLENSFSDGKSQAFKLKDTLENLMNPQVNYLDETDSQELKKELQPLSEELRFLINNLEKSLETEQLSIAFEGGNVSEQYEIVMKYDNSTKKTKGTLDSIQATLDTVVKRYAISPEAILARKIRSIARDKNLELRDVNDLAIYKLPLIPTHCDNKNKVRSFELGERQEDRDHRYILLTGMTGAGKSLLVNNMINYVVGVSHSDHFRFQLVVSFEEISERGEGHDKSTSEANSMTSWVTSFTLHWQEGFRIPFSLTVVDTPGFGDTRGLEYDEEIVSQIKSLFNNMAICPVQELTSIGLLIQASQARITEEQKYIFNQVLNLFGRDMSNNIFLVFTFADAQPPPALKVVEDNKIPYAPGCTFKFNNSAVYAPNTDPMSESAWEFGYHSMKEYFTALGRTEPVSLKLTKQVLDERERLRLLLNSLQGKITEGMNLLKQIEDQSRVILALDGTIKVNRNFKVKKQSVKCELQEAKSPITNCGPCNFTCHSPCKIVGDLKSGCGAIDRQTGCCFMCPGKCSYDVHTNGTQIYVYTPFEIEETVENMMKAYDVALGDRNAKRNLLQKMLLKYQEQKSEVYSSIKEANRCSNKLEECALRNSFLNNVDYIDRLILSEDRSSRPNKTHRIAQLQHMREMAIILQDAKKSPDKLTSHVSEYEAEIVRMIDAIAEENEEEESCEEPQNKEEMCDVASGSSKAEKINKSFKKSVNAAKKWLGEALTSIF